MEETQEEQKKEFEYEERIDMRIYDVSRDDAKWFRQWCQQIDVRMNVGFKLLRILADYTGAVSVLASDIERIKEKLELDEKEEKKPKVPKTYGGKKDVK